MVKRNCNNCKALNRAEYPYTCNLGIPIKYGKEISGIVVEYKPSRECPKPLTLDQYYKSLEERRNGQWN